MGKERSSGPEEPESQKEGIARVTLQLRLWLQQRVSPWHLKDPGEEKHISMDATPVTWAADQTSDSTSETSKDPGDDTWPQGHFISGMWSHTSIPLCPDANLSRKDGRTILRGRSNFELSKTEVFLDSKSIEDRESLFLLSVCNFEPSTTAFLTPQRTSWRTSGEVNVCLALNNREKLATPNGWPKDTLEL